MEKAYCVYMLASRRNGTLYVGITSRLAERTWAHKQRLVEGFTRQHDIHHLVWYEVHATAESAITREKQIKRWNRAWKLRLIESVNPYWNDLSTSL